MKSAQSKPIRRIFSNQFYSLIKIILCILAILLSPSGDAAELEKAKAPEAASPKDDGQWTMPSKDFANTRYSELDEINSKNVDKLKVAFAISTGTMAGQESAPIVVGDTLYFVTPY